MTIKLPKTLLLKLQVPKIILGINMEALSRIFYLFFWYHETSIISLPVIKTALFLVSVIVRRGIEF